MVKHCILDLSLIDLILIFPHPDDSVVSLDVEPGSQAFD